METGKRIWRGIFGWVLALLLCGMALYEKMTASPRLRKAQQAVFGIQPEQVEAAFSAVRHGADAVEVFSLAD